MLSVGLGLSAALSASSAKATVTAHDGPPRRARRSVDSATIAAVEIYLDHERRRLRLLGTAMGLVADQVVVCGFGTSGRNGAAVTGSSPVLIASLSKNLTTLAS